MYAPLAVCAEGGVTRHNHYSLYKITERVDINCAEAVLFIFTEHLVSIQKQKSLLQEGTTT